MSSMPNKFNPHCDDNNRGFSSIQMNQNSQMVHSRFITSDHTNHGDLFSSSPSFSCFHNSHASSSSFGFQNSHVENHMMKRNIISDDNYFSITNNPHFTRVSFTQTITNKFTAIVPTNTLDAVQYDAQRVERAMNPKTNIWNPIFSPPNTFDKQCEFLNPKPLNVIFPSQNSAYPQHLDMFSLSSKHNHDQRVLQDGRSMKKILKPTIFFEATTDYIESQENEKSNNDHNDGRTHSLPYEKYGPYTCPKCNGVFDTSQKFAAHMSSHYKNETSEEREQRIRAKNKRKFCKLNREINGEPQKTKQEDVANNSEKNYDKTFQHLVVVKEEFV
ncbi:putative transcription factor C2H2 family [Arabidopsis thaliana]|uniref:Zinc finger C2H2-type n=1 Tax=Arabidopsis thaliana x Arabidopsis arenosa TaxID=1240361 RepID=A0A8T2FYM1_9BRAS|nr:Zinc finger C2H2-type [Arabidopsis thaliana x Arabidopsis arenosa]